MNFMQGFYRHNKTGNIYYAEKTLKNCTNTREDEILVEFKNRKNKMVIQIKDDRFLLQLLLISLRLPFP